MSNTAPPVGLKARHAGEFPKHCRACGRVYRCEAEYLQQTVGLTDGIRQVVEDEGVFLEVFRNCVCGSTLLSDFDNRRDHSLQGDRHRQLFDACLQAMVAGGIDTQAAHAMLRRLIRRDD